MQLIKKIALCFLVTCSLPVILIGYQLPTAAPEQVGLSAEKLSDTQSVMQKLVNEKRIAGGVVVVARRGKVVQFETCGMMDIEDQKPMKRDTIFRIYSMSKPITNAAAMILYEEGKIKLDDAVSEYIPQFKGLKVVTDPDAEEVITVPAEREMTVRDLMRHTSGLTYGIFGNTNVDKLYRKSVQLSPGGESLRSMTKKLATIPLLYQPGSKWHYSVSTDVLGCVVEVASGQSLDKFFAERIFEPLGMEDTAFYVPEEKIERFATNYAPKLMGGLRAIDEPETSRYTKAPSFFSGGGGLVSTASDYMRFCLMLLNKGKLGKRRLLKAKTVEMMTKNQLPQQAFPIGSGERVGVGFGLGFSVRVEHSNDAPASRVGEYGWGGMASTHFWISPNDEIAVVVLTQYIPFSNQAERAVKPIVYDAILDR
ncbi:MAG: serine hydrolase domain-containing protein [Planctomycetota bacterium]|jgi:CubicO group peptidase (beta-lactamase class C family)